MDYVRQFQNKAGSIVGSHQPNRPALVLYFGDIAMRGRKALREKLLSQIPANYHSAIVEGAFCSASEADGLPFMSVENDHAAAAFGECAAAWRTPDNLMQAETFLTDLLQQTTARPIAVTMAELDVYLVVGNDGGACELWPTILNILSNPSMTVIAVKWHLVWMFRELAAYQQPRDLPMYRLLKAIENKRLTAEEAAAVPEMQAIPCALEAWKSALSITVVSDRNQTGVCSNDVWNASCEAIAGYMLAHMFSNYALPQVCTCAMYDAIYPDTFWSTGFQISALLKLENELRVREAARMQTFTPMLAQAWNITSLQSETIIPLLTSALPSRDDLYTLPVNPTVDKGSLKSCKYLGEAVRLLYGERFEAFFADALESGTFAELISRLTDTLGQTVERFAAANGPSAAAALLDENAAGSLPALFVSCCRDGSHTARMDTMHVTSVGLFQNPIDYRQREVVERSAERFGELHAKAIALLCSKLNAAMRVWRAAYVQKADALANAIATVREKLNAVFSGVMLSYHHTVKQYADSSRLYIPNITDRDFETLDRCFTVKDPVNSLMKTLTQLNLDNNSFITLSMQNAFTQLGYLNGAADLKAALDAFCKTAVFSPMQYVRKEVYILPSEGDWSNGGRVYGLIRLYSAPDGVSLLQSVSYLSNLNGADDLNVAAGRALPAEAAPVPEQIFISDAPAEWQDEDTEPEKPIGKVQYNRPDSLLVFEWPQIGVEMITITVRSTTNYGETPYEQTINLPSKKYITSGGAVLPNVRLYGRCEVTFSWYEYGVQATRTGIMTVEPVHISRILTEKGKDYVLQVTASEQVPNLERYLMLQVRKGNGSVVSYRLPKLVNGSFTINQMHCSGKPQIVLSEERWKDYFSF